VEVILLVAAFGGGIWAENEARRWTFVSCSWLGRVTCVLYDMTER